MLRKLWQVAIAVAVIILAFRLVNWGVRHGGALPPVPTPNGYERLIAAARAVSPPAGDLADLKEAQLRQSAEQNRTTLQEARKAIQLPSAVPLEATPGWEDRHAADLKQFKRLALQFGIEGRTFMLDGRTNEAVACQIDILRLAHTLRRGGILVDGINGLILETVAVASLQSLLPQLPADTCRQTAQALEGLESQRESPARLLETERQWAIRRFGLIARIGSGLGVKKQGADFLRRDQESSNRARRLLLRLATRAYTLETGKTPTKPAELVPGYLKTVPKDAATGAEMPDLPG